MIVRNPTDRAIAFELGRQRYELPPGAECDVPEWGVALLVRRGTPVAVGSAPGADAPRVAPAAAPLPAPPVLPAGAEIGGAVLLPGEDDEPSEDEGRDTLAESPVADAVQQLAQQGVQLPGVGRAKRR